MSKPVKIIIVGNGFGGTYTLKHLDKIYKRNKNVELTLVGEKNYFLFTPLLHEVATGGINRENIVESIHKVLGRCLSSFYLGKVDQVNLKDKTIKVGEALLQYDFLVLATGAQTNYYDIPGAKEYTLPLKSIEDAVKIKNHCIAQMEKASHMQSGPERKKVLSFVIVGGGATGVELAAEMQEFLVETFGHYMHKKIINDISITLVQKMNELIPQFPAKIRQTSLKILTKKGIKVLLDTEVKEVTKNHIVLGNNEKIETEMVLWVAGIKPTKINFDTEINLAPNGKIAVNQFLQLNQYPEVFALGDMASYVPKGQNTPLPTLAQVAVDQAKTVAYNIEHLRRGKNLKSYSYKSRGSLISLGQWMAAGRIYGFNISGRITWWIWRTVYLMKLLSWKKKVKVAIGWTMNLFSPRDVSEL
ncbi:NAD(P)/FAD-dependent oxidoreductase [Candidatus Woesebacteria bacterium]|nr:NAD(P)/FAD-dependent oxidoreductase [Candidatus Woesebacteria bacterium]